MVEELEWKTRRDRINKRLKALNPAWKVVKYSEKLNTKTLKRHAVEEYPTAKGPADYAPIFTRRGGLGKVRTVFQEDLNTLIEELNYAIAA